MRSYVGANDCDTVSRTCTYNYTELFSDADDTSFARIFHNPNHVFSHFARTFYSGLFTKIQDSQQNPH